MSRGARPPICYSRWMVGSSDARFWKSRGPSWLSVRRDGRLVATPTSWPLSSTRAEVRVEDEDLGTYFVYLQLVEAEAS